jgi:hypothetical protein
MTSVPRGRFQPMSSFPVADSSETSPWVGTVQLLRKLQGIFKQEVKGFWP